MEFNTDEIILGSRSPRRQELLQLIVPGALIRQLPPRTEEEPGFEKLHDWDAIDRRLREIARTKCDDVLAQLDEELPAGDEPRQVVITADTTIVVSDSKGQLHALGQPPEGDSWKEVVRGWFREYYAGKTHTAVTALCVAAAGERPIERIVKTAVTFHAGLERRLEWYLESGEPRGKAGGYAIQGAGGIFVSRVEGSLSNVVGLPLEALLEILEQLELVDA